MEEAADQVVAIFLLVQRQDSICFFRQPFAFMLSQLSSTAVMRRHCPHREKT